MVAHQCKQTNLVCIDRVPCGAEAQTAALPPPASAAAAAQQFRFIACACVRARGSQLTPQYGSKTTTKVKFHPNLFVFTSLPLPFAHYLMQSWTNKFFVCFSLPLFLLLFVSLSLSFPTLSPLCCCCRCWVVQISASNTTGRRRLARKFKTANCLPSPRSPPHKTYS